MFDQLLVRAVSWRIRRIKSIEASLQLWFQQLIVQEWSLIMPYPQKRFVRKQRPDWKHMRFSIILRRGYRIVVHIWYSAPHWLSDPGFQTHHTVCFRPWLSGGAFSVDTDRFLTGAVLLPHYHDVAFSALWDSKRVLAWSAKSSTVREPLSSHDLFSSMIKALLQSHTGPWWLVVSASSGCSDRLRNHSYSWDDSVRPSSSIALCPSISCQSLRGIHLWHKCARKIELR